MNIVDIVFKIIDWFVPKALLTNHDKLQSSRLIVVISIILAIWMPFNFRFGTFAGILIIGLIVLSLLMPFLLKLSGTPIIAANFIVGIITFSVFYRVFWTAGFDASVLWAASIGPVLCVLLVGNLNAVIWAIINAICVFAFYFLEANHYVIQGAETITLDDKATNIIFLTVILTLISLYLERSKNQALKTRQVEVDRTIALAEDMRKIGLEIRRNSKTIYSTSNELTKTMRQMKSSAEEISTLEEEGSTAINQSTNTIQELSASLEETLKKMKELEQLSTSIESQGLEGSESVKLSAGAMSKINESRQEYDTILQAITDIADSAHLLSLNAAIEAAKAGEFGKGFFVVVEEIRDLATRSNDAVVDIRKVMKQGEFVIIRGRNVISSLFEVFSIVGDLVAQLSRQIKSIAIAIEEQDIGIKEIAKGTDEIAASSEENVLLIQSLHQSIEDNTNTIENLHQIAEQLEKQIVRMDADS